MPLSSTLSTTLLWSPAYLLLVTLGPFVVFAVCVHILERLMERRLSVRFGWKSVLWTGWLGVPVHELSHALFCFVFGHEIKDMALFRPDRQSRRLGFVLHSYRRGSRWQEIGNLFIGVAPLIGGTVALCLLLVWFYPDVAASWQWEGSSAGGTDSGGSASFWNMLSNSVGHALSSLLRWGNLATLRFWLFVYLVTCVGSHMAPSFDDYRGSLKGSLWLAILLAVGAAAISWVVRDSAEFGLAAHMALLPIHVMLLLALILCGLATLAVFTVTEITDYLGLGRRKRNPTGTQGGGVRKA